MDAIEEMPKAQKNTLLIKDAGMYRLIKTERDTVKIAFGKYIISNEEYENFEEAETAIVDAGINNPLLIDMILSMVQAVIDQQPKN